MTNRIKENDEKFCGDCGEIIKEKAEICPKCGVRQIETRNLEPLLKYNPNPKSRGVACFLALFFGGLGIHKFYLDQAGQGIFYIMFCWTLIPSFFAVCEAIIYAFTSNERFQRKMVGS